MSKEFVRFLIFAVIGLFNATLDTLIWKFLVSQFEKYPKILDFFKSLKLNQYAAAHALSFIISSTSSFFLNRHFTWADTQTNDSWQIVRFYSVATFSWFLTTLVMNFLTGFEPILALVKKQPFLHKHWPLCAKILTIGVSTVTNFLGYQLFVF